MFSSDISPPLSDLPLCLQVQCYSSATISKLVLPHSPNPHPTLLYNFSPPSDATAPHPSYNHYFTLSFAHPTLVSCFTCHPHLVLLATTPNSCYSPPTPCPQPTLLSSTSNPPYPANAHSHPPPPGFSTTNHTPVTASNPPSGFAIALTYSTMIYR